MDHVLAAVLWRAIQRPLARMVRRPVSGFLEISHGGPVGRKYNPVVQQLLLWVVRRPVSGVLELGHGIPEGKKVAVILGARGGVAARLLDGGLVPRDVGPKVVRCSQCHLRE